MYDLCVIGSGPGGYVCAIEGVKLGLKVCIVENVDLGGCCLNWGCIPTKSILYQSYYKQDLSKPIHYYLKKADSVVEKMRKGLEFLIKSYKIDVLPGTGRLDANKNKIIITSIDSSYSIYSKFTVIASGAKSNKPNFGKPEDLITAKGFLKTDLKFNHVAILGGGAIGCEFASFLQHNKIDVTIIEKRNSILPFVEDECGAYLAKSLKSMGVKLEIGSSLKEIKKNGNRYLISIIDDKTNEGKDIEADCVLCCIGNTPNLSPIEKINDIELQNGRIWVDDSFETSRKDVFAIGDVNNKPPFLAHNASNQGKIVAKKIFKLISGESFSSRPFNPELIPYCIYSFPQIASIGLTEKEALVKFGNENIVVGSCKSISNGSSVVMEDDYSFVKVIFHKQSERLLGAHVVGRTASEQISPFSIIKSADITLSQVCDAVFPHPTISEMTYEACLKAFEKIKSNKF